jgi:hypothetical protein
VLEDLPGHGRTRHRSCAVPTEANLDSFLERVNLAPDLRFGGQRLGGAEAFKSPATISFETQSHDWIEAGGPMSGIKAK